MSAQFHDALDRYEARCRSYQIEQQEDKMFKYLVTYGGGSGPDVWESTLVVWADNIHDALAHAENVLAPSAWIVSIEQED